MGSEALKEYLAAKETKMKLSATRAANIYNAARTVVSPLWGVGKALAGEAWATTKTIASKGYELACAAADASIYAERDRGVTGDSAYVSRGPQWVSLRGIDPRKTPAENSAAALRYLHKGRRGKLWIGTKSTLSNLFRGAAYVPVEGARMVAHNGAQAQHYRNLEDVAKKATETSGSLVTPEMVHETNRIEGLKNLVRGAVRRTKLEMILAKESMCQNPNQRNENAFNLAVDTYNSLATMLSSTDGTEQWYHWGCAPATP